MALFGTKAKHRKPAAAMQTPFTRESLAKVQEDARNRHYADTRAVREASQATFDAEGLPRFVFEDDAR